jgi:hypothetical protein
MQEFKEHVRRLAGEDHPLARLLHERRVHNIAATIVLFGRQFAKQ